MYFYHMRYYVEIVHGLTVLHWSLTKLLSKRFQPDVAPQNDMLGSFLRQGLTQEQAEPETIVSLYDFKT